MKKIYMQPCTKVVAIKVNQILCGSITTEGDNLKVTISGGDSGDFDDNTINSRESFWDW